MKLFLILFVLIWIAKSEYICTDNACADGWILQRDTSSCCTGVCVPDEGPRDLFEPVMDCSSVRCASPSCDSYYTPPGECCPVCCESECEALCGRSDGGPYKCCGGDPCVKDCSQVTCPAVPGDCPPDRLIFDEETGCCQTCLGTCSQMRNLGPGPQNCIGRRLLDRDCQWVCECNPTECPSIVCPENYHAVLKEGECCPYCEKNTGSCEECCREDQVEYYEEGASCPTCFTCQTFAPVDECESYQTRVYSPDQPCGMCAPDCTNVNCGNRNNGRGAKGNGQKKGHGPKCENGEVFVRDKGQCCSGSCQPDCSTVLCIAIACEENQVPIYEGCCITRCENYCDERLRPQYNWPPGFRFEHIPGTCWESKLVPLQRTLECIHPEVCPHGQHLSTLPGESCPQCRECRVYEVIKWEVEVNGAMCKRPCNQPIVGKICAGGCSGERCCNPIQLPEKVTFKVRCFKEWLQPQWYDDIYYTKSVMDCGCQ